MRCNAARVEQRGAEAAAAAVGTHAHRQAGIKREPSGGCGRWRRKCVKLVVEDNWETVVGGARDFRRDVVE